MVFDKVVLICPDFKWLRGQISVHIIIHTICKPTSFWPFKIQTSPDFRFSLYWVLLHFACKTPVELHLWRIMVLRWQSTNRLALSTHSGGYGHTRKGSRFQNNLNWQTFHHAQERSADSVLSWCTGRTSDTALEKYWGIRPSSGSRQSRDLPRTVRSWSLGNPSRKIMQGVGEKKVSSHFLLF